MASRHEIWFLAHPKMEDILNAPRRHVPYIYHADDAQQTKRVGKTIRLSSWCSPVAIDKDPLKSRFPLFVTSNSDILHRGVERNLEDAAAWSFKAAGEGVNPLKGPGDTELPLEFRNCSGKLLAGGICLTYGGCCGDWKFQKEDFSLPYSYNTDNICMRCLATKNASPCNYANALWDAPGVTLIANSKIISVWLSTRGPYRHLCQCQAGTPTIYMKTSCMTMPSDCASTFVLVVWWNSSGKACSAVQLLQGHGNIV